MSLPKNIELHVFQLRTGAWAVRINGFARSVTLRGGGQLKTPGKALEAAARFIAIYDGMERALEKAGC